MVANEKYTIDAEGKGLGQAVWAEIAERCDRLNFARVVQVLDEATFGEFAAAADGYYNHMASEGRVQTVDDKTGRLSKACTYPPIIQQDHADFIRHARGLVASLPEATLNSERLHTPNADIYGLQVNRYNPGDFFERHYDQVSGVVLILAVRGLAKTTLEKLTHRRLIPNKLEVVAEFTGEENELLVLPAAVGDRGGKFDQIWHRMTNEIPKSKAEATIRQTVAMLYGQDEAHADRVVLIGPAERLMPFTDMPS